MTMRNSFSDTSDMDFYIKKFLDGRENNGRYMSFDHCYSFFQNNYSCKNEDVKKQMALHLFAYLASWGMLRNSFLMYKDYTYLVGVIDILANAKRDCYCIPEIMELKNNIISYFKGPDDNPTTYVNGKKTKPQYVNERKNWDTLTSKIMLGTLGCVPAYDDFFKGVAKKVFGMNPGFNETGLNHLMRFRDENMPHLRELQKLTTERCGFTYPEMKIIDMYFWQKGYLEGISLTPRYSNKANN